MNLILFIKIVAWVMALFASFLVIVRMWAAAWYHGNSKGAELQRLRDKLRGGRRTYPIGLWLFVALVCWALIASMR